MKRSLLFFFAFLSSLCIAQQTAVFHLDSLPATGKSAFADPGTAIDRCWKYHKGDDMSWASPDLDDRNWQLISPALKFDSIPSGLFEGIGWFRLHITVDTTLTNRALGIAFAQTGASEVFLDGKLIHRFGVIDRNNIANEDRYDPQMLPVDIIFRDTREHVIAVRYANARAIEDWKAHKSPDGGFGMKISELEDGVFYRYTNANVITAIFTFYFTFFLALSFLHFTIFIFFRANRSNLYYSIFAGAFGTFFLSVLFKQVLMIPDVSTDFGHFATYLSDFYVPALLAMLYSIFYGRILRIFWVWVALAVLDLITNPILGLEDRYFGTTLYVIFLLESLRVIIAAIWKKKDGAWIIGVGIISTVLFFAFFLILSIVNINSSYSYSGWGGFFIGLTVIYATLSIPLSMTVYLAREFATTSKHLKKKLIEVEDLSAKSLEQEKEKQRILETQKDVLEVQVKERTLEITEQKKLIEEKNKDITDSISYAKRIQEALLPDPQLLKNLFPDSFILFRPKDIVSGDFYWFAEAGGKKIFAAADCTGHGVPGALMSMIGCNILNKLVLENNITRPDLLLNRLHEEVRLALKQKDRNTETRDGMDIAIICVKGDTLEYAGAHRPLYHVKNNALEEIKADKFPIGGIQTEEKRVFTNHVLTLQQNEVIYLSSDGFADQFGGESGKKLMTKHFKEMLLKICDNDMQAQRTFLDDAIVTWKGNREQIDDILVVGIKF